MVHPQNPNFLDFEEEEDAEARCHFSGEIDSNCSTPFVSAPSSPCRASPAAGYFYSAPASPMHYALSSYSPSAEGPDLASVDASAMFEFEFSSRLSGDSSVAIASMTSADELFLNGQIRPMKLSSHLQTPQILAPLINIDGEEGEENKEREKNPSHGGDSVKRGRSLRLRSRSMHRKARSLSPFRNAAFQWDEDNGNSNRNETKRVSEGETAPPSNETTPSSSRSSSSRSSSSSGRYSKKWVFLKDLLHRSKSEGRENAKEKFWSSISFSSSKEKKLSVTIPSSTVANSTENAPEASKKKEKPKGSKTAWAKTPRAKAGKPANGVARRRVPLSAHELHYTTNRAQAEEMKRRTYLPYRQGLFGCLGFSSKGYGALSGFAKTLTPVSSR